MEKRETGTVCYNNFHTQRKGETLHICTITSFLPLSTAKKRREEKEQVGINIKPLQEDSTVSSALEYKGRLHLLYLLVSFDSCCVRLLLVERASNTRKEHYGGSNELYDQKLLVLLQHSPCKYFN